AFRLAGGQVRQVQRNCLLRRLANAGHRRRANEPRRLDPHCGAQGRERRLDAGGIGRGVGRILPVPRRARRRRRQRRRCRDPTRRQCARSGSHRRRRRAGSRNGVHRRPSLPSLISRKVLKPAIFAACLSLALPGRAQAVECADFWTWVESGCRHVVDTYHHGDDALLVSGYEWHIPYAWTPERRAAENELAWGGGWARSREQPNGDTENVYLLVFGIAVGLDRKSTRLNSSHRTISYAVFCLKKKT